jgi:hypothetical protein
VVGVHHRHEERGLAQVLAEPTLITADGQKASFLAGGEIPIPIAQAGAGFTSVTIEWKKFGISLDFTPTIRDKETIVMKVMPEVSSLDFANAVILGGFRIPALRVRRADTEIELKEGQSFAIAGLYSSDLAQTKKKIPLIGDIPVSGSCSRARIWKSTTASCSWWRPDFRRAQHAGQPPHTAEVRGELRAREAEEAEQAGSSGPVQEPAPAPPWPPNSHGSRREVNHVSEMDG